MTEASNDLQSSSNNTRKKLFMVFRNPDKKSSIPMTFFNFSNSIVGTGIIVLSDAVQKSGIGLGLILTCISGIISAFTSYTLVVSATKINALTYPTLVKKALGKHAYILAVIANLFLPYSMCVAYGMAITDNVILMFKGICPTISILQKREFIVFLALIVIALPLSIPKHISILQHISLVSIIFVLFYTIVFAAKMPSQSMNILVLPEYWNFARPGIAQALATISLAFTAHHNVLPLFNVLRDNTIKRFSFSLYASFLFSAIIYYLVIISGYVSFSGTLSGNILNSYCVGDVLMLITRGIFSITVISTLPLQAISVRNSILELSRKYLTNNRTTRIAITVLLFVTAYGFAILPINIDTVIEVGGALSASPLIMIFPPLVYLKVVEEAYFRMSITCIVSWILICSGFMLMVVGTTMSIIDATSVTKMAVPLYWCNENIM